MAIIKKSELTSVYTQTFSATRDGYLGRKYHLSEARSRNKVTVFLSHSHSDKDFIQKAVVLLSNVGVDVYVDWKDPSMPTITSGETAQKIKDKITSNRKFVMLASAEAIKSNWVNWELGYGDSKKYNEHIALFPIEDRDGQWKDAEYLQIYPRIEKERELEITNGIYGFVDQFYVIFPDKKKIRLTTWLNN